MTDLYDYAVGRVKAASTQRSAGRWVPDPGRGGAEVSRNVSGRGGGPFEARLRNRSGRRVPPNGSGSKSTTQGKPIAVEVDPRTISHDWNALNNRKVRGLLGFKTRPRQKWYFDTLFLEGDPARPTHRGRGARALVQLLRRLVLGAPDPDRLPGPVRAERSLAHVDTRPFGKHETRAPHGIGFDIKLRNPVKLQQARTTQTSRGVLGGGEGGSGGERGAADQSAPRVRGPDLRWRRSPLDGDHRYSLPRSGALGRGRDRRGLDLAPEFGAAGPVAGGGQAVGRRRGRVS